MQGVSTLDAMPVKISKQASQLMKMYGNSGNLYHRSKHMKSVERAKAHPVVAAAGYTTNYQMYQAQTQQSLSKLSQPIESQQRMSLASGPTPVKYMLNNSMLIGPKANQTLIYDSSHNLASLESQRHQAMLHQQNQQRNLNQSQTYNKFKVKNATLLASHQSQQDASSFRKRLSSKNVLRSRYNNNVMMQNEQGVQSSSNALVMKKVNNNTNLLLIQ